jgi:DedD protein
MARRDATDNPPTDPALPFKRRARRRLVGALVIGVGLAVALPVVLDREPHYPRPDIRVDIPPRDVPLPVRAQNEADSGSPSTGARPATSAEATRASRAEAGRAAEARLPAGSAPGDKPLAGETREPVMTQQLDVPADPTASRSQSSGARPDADAARVQAARAEAAKQEAAKQEAAKQEAAKQEAAKQEAARQEAARAQIARQEAARQEAARQEASRQALAKAELPRALPSQNWAVQIGQFARPENARAAENRAAGLGLRAYSETLQTAQGERFRVRAGPFANRAAAEEARSRLIAAGLEAALIAPEASR